MKKALTARELLDATDLDDGHVIEGKELSRLFWMIKQREKDLERSEKYWSSVHDALTTSYAELELLKAGLEKRVAEQVGDILHHVGEVEALNVQLQAKVRDRSRELMLALGRAGMDHATSFLAPGTVVGNRARVVRRLGEGAMGSVYAADDLLTGRKVALKILRSADPCALRYFVAEAEAASVVSHAAIARTLHVDVTEEGQIFQLMDLVDGVTLARRMRVTRLGHGASARIGSAIAGALAAAHAHGVIHRDIKPDNVLLSVDAPGVRVLDFGIAKRAFVDSQTMADAVVGTPGYMSPDQIRSPASVTSAADVYSLGVVLFEALTGHRPFESSGTEAMLFAHLNEPAPRIRDLAPGVPVAFATLVQECLDKEPSRRPRSNDLESLLARFADDTNAPLGEAIGKEAKALVGAEDATRCDA